jgi:hypothetical protein
MLGWWRQACLDRRYSPGQIWPLGMDFHLRKQEFDPCPDWDRRMLHRWVSTIFGWGVKPCKVLKELTTISSSVGVSVQWNNRSLPSRRFLPAKFTTPALDLILNPRQHDSGIISICSFVKKSLRESAGRIEQCHRGRKSPFIRQDRLYRLTTYVRGKQKPKLQSDERENGSDETSVRHADTDCPDFESQWWSQELRICPGRYAIVRVLCNYKMTFIWLQADPLNSSYQWLTRGCRSSVLRNRIHEINCGVNELLVHICEGVSK